jgi:SagB-type dehydrogenase family enzyme
MVQYRAIKHEGSIMNKTNISIFALCIVAALILGALIYIYGGFAMTTVELPTPQINNPFPLDKAIKERRSIREFQNHELTAEQIATLLWAADGITDTAAELRSAPSAGATYPLDLYVVKSDGIWIYKPAKNALGLIKKGDFRKALSTAAQGQTSVADAALDVIVVEQLSRIQPKYGEHSIQFCYLEAGHIAQNLALQAVALGLGSVPIGAFVDSEVNKVLELTPKQNSIYIIAVGIKK